jgi:hypothetical protein
MLFCAFSLWLAAMAISRWRGTPAALVLCALCGPLAFIYLASPGTEANGLSAALLTLPLFIAALRTGSAVMAACAVAGTFLALTLRMGAFFIIPALFLWLFILFRKNRRPCVAALALSLFLVAAIAVSNFMLTRYYSPRGMSIGGNFSSTVCGMSVNGSWDTCDFLYAAELAALPSIAAHHKFLYAKTYENIQEQPLSFLKSMAWNGAAFLRHIWHHTTGSIVEESVPWPLLAPLLLALYFGCTGYLRSQKERGEILLYSAVFGGLFLSSLFIMRSEGFRAIAASYPLLWLMLSMGLAVPSEAGAAKEASGFSPLPSLFAIGFMFLASIGGPFIAKTNTPYYAPDYGQHPFENNEMAADLGLFGGVTVVADGTELPNNIPALYETVFLRKIAANYWGRGNELAAAMKQQLSPPYTVYAGAFQYRNGTLRPARSTYIVEGGEALPPGQARYFLKFEKFYQALYISYYRLMDEKLPSAD